MNDADKALRILMASFFVALMVAFLVLALSGVLFAHPMMDMMTLGAALIGAIVVGGSGLAHLHPRVRAYFAAQRRFDEYYVYQVPVVEHETGGATGC